MQALTGLFARQFGTPNYAAHGGFCSVNMAAGMIYTIGGSFWEFGGPDLDRAKLFVMIGTAEDHHSNPLKIAISKFKRDGGRFVSINPVRTGYSAIADEWMPIRPGTDGALLLALIHELIALGLYDREFLARYTNAGSAREPGCGARRLRPDGAQSRRRRHQSVAAAQPAVVGPPHAQGRRAITPTAPTPRCWATFTLPDGTPVTARVPAAGRARRRLHAGMGRRHHRHSGGNDPPPRARDGRHRARPEDRAADRVDRQLGHASTTPSPATRSPSTRCAASRRTPTASRRSARCRS